MAGEWREVTVGEIAPFTYGKGLPEARRNPTGNIPVYGSNGVVGLHDVPLTNGPTVVIGRKGTVGAVHYSPVPCWPIDTTFFVTGSDPSLVRYRYYLLKSLGLEHMNSDSAVPGLNRDAAHVRRVRIPSKQTDQRAIACILGSLDDKIELNRRMNKTLEEMARAIFKSWFVDFDPVRTKAAIRREHPKWSDEQVSRLSAEQAGAACPKLKPDIAALFPDSFEDSELGEIPKGWRVGQFGDIVQIHDSKRIPLSSRERAKRQGPYRYYGAVGIVDYVDDFLFDGTYVLVGEDGSVVTDLGNPVVQYVWGKFWVNNHAHVLKAAGSFSDEHLLLVLQQVYVVPFVTGAVQPKLSQTNMNAIPILRAKPEVNIAFNKLIEPIFAKVRMLHDEIGLLAALRDALLPKLISGELRVPDAERIAGRCV
ncbi:MAG: restriction endonuclease subunit S [Phycisphaerae bacterium]|nr:restriction endonuclease subunit S [Phycisphaerae bacterium]